MNSTMDRRRFLKVSAVTTGGLLIGWEFTRGAEASAAEREIALNPWIKITPDNWTTVILSQAEMGQGIDTTMSAWIADELGADWKLVRRENAIAAPAYQNPAYHWQFTGNAESTRVFFAHTRTLAAAAREMLIAAAAARWDVDAASLRAEHSFVIDGSGNRRASFGELAADAATLPVPTQPHLKSPSELKLVGGVSLSRVDIPAKVDGSAVFGIDVVVPDMAHAAVLFPRAFGARIESIEITHAKAMPGVIDIVVLRDALTAVGEKSDAIIAVAAKYWQSVRALNAVAVRWTPPPAGPFDSKTVAELYVAAFATKPFEPVLNEGDAANILSAAPAASVIEAEYCSGWQAHAPLEPMNCTALVEADRCTLWAPSQGQEMAQLIVSLGLGIPKENVVVNRTYLGGGFGRRLIADFAVLAAYASRAVKRTVKLIWSREMDMYRDHYRPAFMQRAGARLGHDGLPEALEVKLVAPTILAPVSPGPFPNPKIDPLSVESLHEIHYAIENLHVSYHLLDVPIPTMVWRTTGAGPNLFFLEAFIDELAHAAGANPYDYRRRLLAKKPGNERLLAVLDLAAEKGAIKNPPRDGRFRGIACGAGFGSFIAQVVELSATSDVAFEIHRVVSVVDCGQVLDPGIASANIAGGVVWSLSQALSSEITFSGGGVAEKNFDGYRILTLPETPVNEIHFINGGASPGGIGEIGPICVPPALSNAIFAATGRRHRLLPLKKYGVSAHAARSVA